MLANLRTLLQKHKVAGYLIILALITLIGASPLILGHKNYQAVSPLEPTRYGFGILITVFAPSLAALITCLLQEGWIGTTRLLRKITIWKVGGVWYAIALLLPSGIVVAATYILQIGSGTQTLIEPKILASFLPVVIFIGAVGEEYGWRGYLLPTLGQKYGNLGASILVGLTWALWHQWPVITQVGGEITLVFIVFLGEILTQCLVFTWIFNHTRESVLLATLFHTGLNISGRLMVTENLQLRLIELGVFAMVAVAILVFDKDFLVNKEPA